MLIYGCWAARRAGEAGLFPNDIDVLVLGPAPRRVLTAVASEAGERLDVPVNASRRSVGEWKAVDPTPFVSTLRKRPILHVMTGDLHV